MAGRSSGRPARDPDLGVCRQGQPATQPHDYTRHGTTTLFAALNVLDGTVLGQCAARFRGIVDLQAAIHRFVAEHNKTAKRFVWPADPDRIIASISKAKRASGADH